MHRSKQVVCISQPSIWPHALEKDVLVLGWQMPAPNNEAKLPSHIERRSSKTKSGSPSNKRTIKVDDGLSNGHTIENSMQDKATRKKAACTSKCSPTGHQILHTSKRQSAFLFLPPLPRNLTFPDKKKQLKVKKRCLRVVPMLRDQQTTCGECQQTNKLLELFSRELERFASAPL